MAEVIQFRPNELGYSHVVCGVCEGNIFHIATDDGDGVELFHSIVCEGCGNVIHVDMRPVFKGDGETYN